MTDHTDDDNPPDTPHEDRGPDKVATDLREDERGSGPFQRESLSAEQKALLHKVVISALAFRAELSAENKARGALDAADDTGGGDPLEARQEALDSAIESVGLAARTLERAILDTAENLTKAKKEPATGDNSVRSLVSGFADEMMRFRPAQVDKNAGEVIDFATWRKNHETEN
ncbi:MAG: hypothetical protein ACPGOV_06315 [Magnetovibrionaceae bacterium]